MTKVAELRTPAAASPPAAGVPPALAQRWTVLSVGALVFLAACLFFSGSAWPVALDGLLADGVWAVVWLAAAGGVGSLVPMPRGPEGGAPAGPQATSAGGDQADRCPPGGLPSHGALAALRNVSAIAMGLGLMSLATLGLGLAGLLNRWTAWGLIAAGFLVLLTRVARGLGRKAVESGLTRWLCADARYAWLWLPAVVTLGLACAASLALPGLLWNTFGDPHGYDVVEYHLQIPREWYELGRIVPLHHNAFSFFPFNVEMHYLLAMHLRGGPWAGMYLAQFMHVGYIATTIAAVAAAARAIGATRAGAAVAGLAAAATPWMLLLAPIAYNEGGLLLFGTLALAWALVGVNSFAGGERGSLRAFALGGALAGFACGSKLTAVPIVLLAVAGVAFVALLARRVKIGWAVAAPAVFGLAGLLTFGPWLVRNTLWAGNPVFPEAATVLGKGHFTDVQVERWSRAHSARPDQAPARARLAAAVNEIVLDWRYGAVVLPLCAAVGIAGVVWRRASNVTVWLFLLLAIQLLFWLCFTHLQSRFFVFAVPVAALLVALPTWKWWRLVAAAAFVGASALTWVRAGNALDLEHKVFDAGTREHLAMIAAAGDETLASRIASARQITLIGDGKVFWYPTPPDGLQYRTVFDVATREGATGFEAWTGTDMLDDVNLDHLYIVDAPELARFQSTYWKVQMPWQATMPTPASGAARGDDGPPNVILRR